MPSVTSSAARARALGLNVAVAVLPVSRLGARSSNLASSATAASSSSDVARTTSQLLVSMSSAQVYLNWVFV
jgi:hypothetical protein